MGAPPARLHSRSLTPGLALRENPRMGSRLPIHAADAQWVDERGELESRLEAEEAALLVAALLNGARP